VPPAETGAKASCHSDDVDDSAAQQIQEERLDLVQVEVR
jgi:hypothetical protein